MAGNRGRNKSVPNKAAQNTSQPGGTRATRKSPSNTGSGGKKILSSPGKSRNTNLGRAHPDPNVKGSVFPKRGKGK